MESLETTHIDLEEAEEAAPPFSAAVTDVLPAPPKFSTPEHPSVRLLESILNAKKLLEKEKEGKDETGQPQPPPYQHRDPHEQPSFTHESLAFPVFPVLYLPPLISALPPSSLSSSDESPPPSSPSSDTSSNPPNSNPTPTVLTTTTRLPSIDPVSLSLHRALHYFRPFSRTYASLSYASAFNWSELRLPEDEEREWYCVAFRSRRREGSNGDALYEADKRAHEEAVQNGGVSLFIFLFSSVS